MTGQLKLEEKCNFCQVVSNVYCNYFCLLSFVIVSNVYLLLMEFYDLLQLEGSFLKSR